MEEKELEVDEERIQYFSEEVLKDIILPKKFTFPFFYTPHTLTKIAIDDLQNYLSKRDNIDHNFGLTEGETGLIKGKMFGVLVIKDTSGKIGYISAFSGKLAGTNNHNRFVPPVFDMLTQNSFFLEGEKQLTALNLEVKRLEENSDYLQLKKEVAEQVEQIIKEIATEKENLKLQKAERKILRQEQKQKLSEIVFAKLEEELVKQSLTNKRKLLLFVKESEEKLQEIKIPLQLLESQIESLKIERKFKSADLQNQLFGNYTFLNKAGKEKSLNAIFKSTVFGKPPAAAGECATPKLLQYAFSNCLEPLAFAEFWWGISPKSEIRKHKHIYPACKGKCEPILKHMLEGINLDTNPLLVNSGKEKVLEIVYEDDHFIVVNKPAGLLSVPGILIKDSVYTRLQKLLPKSEPMIIHRLDMATSGILVVAKTKSAHKHIQKQFINRKVTKRYVALLDGYLKIEEGEVNLPLRGDIDDRPRQLVCFEHGKNAHTKWKLIERKKGVSKVYFWPITGRTHQLRIHAAHSEGLNTPILGDELYGTSEKRLYLHAAYISFVHPISNHQLEFEVKEDF